MSGLVGMVAKRGGEVLGKVVAFQPENSEMYAGVYIDRPGQSPGYLQFAQDLTFHPADPAPSWPSVEWYTEAKAKLAEDALRQSIRTALGLGVDATDGEIVERVRGLVKAARFRPGAVVHAPDPVSGRWMPVQPEAAPADQMTADPPPPAPPGEERWYRATSTWNESWTHILVRGAKALFCGQGVANLWEGAWDLDTFLVFGGSERSLHPVPRPEWAEGEGE